MGRSHRPPLLPIIVGFLAGALLMRHRHRHDSLPPSSPPISRPSKRYEALQWFQAIAVFATFIALVFSYQATRAAEHQVALANRQVRLGQDQLSLTRTQAQPSLHLVHTRPQYFLSLESHVPADTLILTVSGIAQNIKVTERTVLINNRAREENHSSWLVVPYWWWNEGDYRADNELATWTWKTRPYDLPSDISALDVETTLRVEYRDVFGQTQVRYLFVTITKEQVGQSLDEPLAGQCAALLWIDNFFRQSPSSALYFSQRHKNGFSASDLPEAATHPSRAVHLCVPTVYDFGNA